MSIILKKSNLLEYLHVSVKRDAEKDYKYFICNWLYILTVIVVGKSKFWTLSFWTRTLPADGHWLMIPSSEIWATESFRLQEHFKLNLCVLPSSPSSLLHCVIFAYKRRLEIIIGWYFSCFLVANWHNIWKNCDFEQKIVWGGSDHSDHTWRKIHAYWRTVCLCHCCLCF